jgi:hypothetical protein
VQRRVALDDAVGIYMGLSNASLDARVSATDVMTVSKASMYCQHRRCVCERLLSTVQCDDVFSNML